jgi:hypothetical protein
VLVLVLVLGGLLLLVAGLLLLVEAAATGEVCFS